MSTPKSRELKYQALRLYHSNQISLNDIKAQFRITRTATFDEYSSQSDQKDAIGTQDRLEKIKKLTRHVAKPYLRNNSLCVLSQDSQQLETRK